MVITLTDLATLSVGALSIILVILAVSYIVNNNKPKAEKFIAEDGVEGFTSAPYGVSVNDVGGLEGPVIYTNQLTKDSKALLAAAKAGKLSDPSHAVLGAVSNSKGFDGALQKQLKVHEIQNKAKNGFQQVEDLKEISKNIAQDNSLHGYINRTGFSTNKIFIDKYATVGIIEDKYMPNRDRPKKLYAVGNAIIVPGFDFDATKALNSQGQGFCPTGGVPGVGLQRHKNTKKGLHTLQEDATKPIPKQSLTGDAKQDKALNQNGIVAAANISTVNQEHKPSDDIEEVPTQVVPAVAKQPEAEVTPEVKAEAAAKSEVVEGFYF